MFLFLYRWTPDVFSVEMNLPSLINMAANAFPYLRSIHSGPAGAVLAKKSTRDQAKSQNGSFVLKPLWVFINV